MVNLNTFSNCSNTNICNNGIKKRCQIHNNIPIDYKYKYGLIIYNEKKKNYYDNIKYQYKNSTLLNQHKHELNSKISNQQSQHYSTTNYGCKPYNCPQNILLIRSEPVKYFNSNHKHKEILQSNKFNKVHHSLERKNNNLLEKTNNLWTSQLFNEKCTYNN